MRKLLLLLLLASPAMAQVPVAMSPLTPISQPFFGTLAPFTDVPLASGCVWTYISGTSSPLATYTDGTGMFVNSNPIILSAGGFGSIWLSNANYRFKVVAYDGSNDNCATGTVQYTVDNVSAWTIINNPSNLFLLGASSDPSGSAGELAYRTDIPCFRAFTTFWDCLVTLTATQTLQNKTLANAAFTGTETGMSISSPALNGTVTGTAVQGTDTKVLSAGTVAGTGAPLCTDVLGGATTSGCTPPAGAAAGCTNFTPVNVTNNVATTNLLSCSIAANALAQGTILNVDLTGIQSTAANQTITLTVSLGGGTSCSTVQTQGIANNQPWNFVAKMSILTSGAGGTANWSCESFGSGANPVAGPNGVGGAPTIAVNTTIANTLLITETMSVANAGNSVTGQLLKGTLFP